MEQPPPKFSLARRAISCLYGMLPFDHQEYSCCTVPQSTPFFLEMLSAIPRSTMAHDCHRHYIVDLFYEGVALICMGNLVGGAYLP